MKTVEELEVPERINASESVVFVRGGIRFEKEKSSSYTKNIVFKNNRYSNGNAKKRTCFVYLGKTYTSFEAWKKVVGRNAGTYQE